jgi:hypothetical protein
VRLIQSRLVTEDLPVVAGPYAALGGVGVPFNEFDIEVPAGGLSIDISKYRSTEEYVAIGEGSRAQCAGKVETILDFGIDDADAQYQRVDALGVEWAMPPATQPWGTSSTMFRNPEGHLVNHVVQLGTERL